MSPFKDPSRIVLGKRQFKLFECSECRKKTRHYTDPAVLGCMRPEGWKADTDCGDHDNQQQKAR